MPKYYSPLFLALIFVLSLVWLLSDMTFGMIYFAMFFGSLFIASLFSEDIRGSAAEELKTAGFIEDNMMSSVVIGILLGGGIIVIGVVISLIFRVPPSEASMYVPALTLSIPAASRTLLNAFLQITVATSEELTFRSALPKLLAPYMGFYPVTFISSAAFAFLHFAAGGWGIALFIFAIISGLLLTFVMQRTTKSIYLTTTAHFINNFVRTLIGG